ncbi:hypothetical protein ACS0TY_020450 [Phlomoides rotata]
MGDKTPTTITAFLQSVKAKSDELALSDDDITLYVCYRDVASVIRLLPRSMRFKELQETLLNHEFRESQLLATANMATQNTRSNSSHSQQNQTQSSRSFGGRQINSQNNRTSGNTHSNSGNTS